MATPQLDLELNGLNEIKGLTKTFSWTPTAQFERNYYVSSSDGAQTIPVTDFTTVRLVVVSSDSNFTVSITADGSTIAFVCQGLFTFDPATAFWATVSAMTITASTTSSQEIDVRIYEESTS